MTSLLAARGGTPVLTDPHGHFTWPPITDADRAAVATQLDTAVSLPGRTGIVAELEDSLARWLGVRHVVTTCTGTAALHSMYAAAGITAGDEVLVPAWTFHATATPLFHLGARPTLVDVTPNGHIDLDAAVTALTPRTRAIIAVHLWGIPEDRDALRRFAERHQLMLLEDGAHAHGATWDGHLTGTYGHAAAFSLNGPKTLSAGEGGFVATNDDELYYRVLLHGQYNKRCRAEIPHDHPLAPYAITGMGLKLRIHPLAAALAKAQLPRLPQYLAGRACLAQRMRQQLQGVPGITVPDLPPQADPSWYALPLRYDATALGGLPIKTFLAAVHAEGATEVDLPGSTRSLADHPLFQNPGALLPGYADDDRVDPAAAPTARHVHATTLKLPVWHDDADTTLADAYTTALTKVAEHHKEIL